MSAFLGTVTPGTRDYSVISALNLGTPDKSREISAGGTPGTREYSVISAFNTPGTREYSVSSVSYTPGTGSLRMTDESLLTEYQ